MSNAIKKSRGTVLATATTATWCIFAAVLIYFVPSFCENFNLWLFDWKLSFTHLPDHHRSIVHLDVDDKALAQFGAWPWDRSLSAEVLRRLTQMGTRLIVFEILYSSARSQDGDQTLFDAVKESGNCVISAGMGLTEHEEEKLSVTGDTTRADLIYDKAWNLNVPTAFRAPKVVNLKNAFLPLPQLIQNAKSLGHICGTPDSDGVYRRIPLLVRLEEHYVPSLSLATLVSYLGLSNDNITVTGKGYVEITPEGQPIRIPVDSKGMMLIRWGKIWETFPHYSVTDVLSNSPDGSRSMRYKDKIVIIGVVATGTTDFGVTPAGVHTPLNRVHSNALNTILMKSFITQIKPFPYVVILGVIFTVLFSVVAGLTRLMTAIIFAFVIIALTILSSVAVFTTLSLELPITEFLFLFVPGTLAGIIVRTSTIERQAARASRAVERYLSPDLLEHIVAQGMELDLSTKRTELTIVFVDVEGFSTISETVDVEYINRLLNDFFESMTLTILHHNGTVDKFLGDGLLAFFGNPIPLENHAQEALRASLEMHKSVGELNTRLSQWGISELEKGINIRISINTGMVIVGNIGSSRRMEYTVLGSAVNIASRLQPLAPSGGIIMTARTHALSKEPVDCVGPDYVRVKGIEKAIEVFKIYPDAITQYFKEI